MISALQREMSRQNNAKLLSYGVSPVQLHCLIIAHIGEQKGETVCQRDIEKELRLRASSVSAMLAILEKKAFITRRYADGNARLKEVALTDLGRQLCIANKQMVDECDEMFSRVLSDEESKELSRLLEKVLSSIYTGKNNKESVDG